MSQEAEIVGVAGLGLLGRGIAACCLAHGFRVVAWTKSDNPHDEAAEYIKTAITDLIEKADFDQALANQWEESYSPVDSLSGFHGCDFVIETVVEDLAIKESVFSEIEETVRADVPIASNTSAIPITLLQRARHHPERFVGMHWAEPGHATRFLEIVRGEQTSDGTVAATVDLARRIGKHPSLVQRDVPGFIVNRIGYAMYREAAHMLESGIADVETIDRSCRNAFGLWAGLCGPFRWIDITGGPELYAKCMERVLPTLCSEGTKLPEPLEKLKQGGAGGQATGFGFYTYDENSPDWQERYHEFVWRMRKVLEEFDPPENASGKEGQD